MGLGGNLYPCCFKAYNGRRGRSLRSGPSNQRLPRSAQPPAPHNRPLLTPSLSPSSPSLSLTQGAAPASSAAPAPPRSRPRTAPALRRRASAAPGPSQSRSRAALASRHHDSPLASILTLMGPPPPQPCGPASSPRLRARLRPHHDGAATTPALRRSNSTRQFQRRSSSSMGKAAAAAVGAEKSRPECVNSSNPFHECSDYCLHKIAEAKQRLDDDLAGSAPPEERTVHPDCINASNPYHVCSEYCFKKIADAKLGSERREQEPPATDAAGSSGKSDVVPEQGDGDDSAAPQEDAGADDGYQQMTEKQKELFQLQLKMNEARKANQQAMVAETKRMEPRPDSRDSDSGSDTNSESEKAVSPAKLMKQRCSCYLLYSYLTPLWL